MIKEKEKMAKERNGLETGKGHTTNYLKYGRERTVSARDRTHIGDWSGKTICQLQNFDVFINQ